MALCICLWDAGSSSWAAVPFILLSLWPHLHISQSFWDFCRHDFVTQNSKDMLCFYFYAFKNQTDLVCVSLAENIFGQTCLQSKTLSDQGVIAPSLNISRVSSSALWRENIILFPGGNEWAHLIISNRVQFVTLIYINLNTIVLIPTSHTQTFSFNCSEVQLGL